MHKNAKDFRMNFAVPWGGLTRGDEVKIELEKKVDVRAGDAFFFRGECIAHKRGAAQEVRGLADFFPHKNVLD